MKPAVDRASHRVSRRVNQRRDRKVKRLVDDVAAAERRRPLASRLGSIELSAERGASQVPCGRVRCVPATSGKVSCG